jgi:hypothetical protein
MTLSYDSTPPPDPVRHLLDRTAWVAFLIFVPICALLAGLELRHYAWKITEPVRYTTDIDNAFEQGTQALRVGYIDRYSQEPLVPRGPGVIPLDYAPGRLAVATLWSKWVHEQTEGPVADPAKTVEWPPPYFYHHARALGAGWRLCRPLMMLNATGEGIAAGAMFVLVFRYSTRGRPGRKRVLLGLLAALLFWFNPAVICNAHCWPQWDSWVFPFLLWAVVAASFDGWFTAGALMGAGAMFKAQILFGLPLLIVWPLVTGSPLKLARLATGLLTLFAAVTVVWDIRTPGSISPATHQFVPGHIIGPAVLWVASVAGAFGGIVVLARAELPWYARLLLTLAVLGLVVWPCEDYSPGTVWIMLFGVAVVAVGSFLFSNRSLPFLGAGFVSAAVLLCIPIFGGDRTWFDSGFARGTSERPALASEENENLAGILQQRYGWELMDPAWTVPPGKTADRLDAFLKDVDPNYHRDPKKPFVLPLKYLLLSVWVLMAVPCAIAAAAHHKNRSPRFLPAVVAPWVVMFAVMAQMHQRYLLWGAGLATGCAAISPGYLLLDILITAVALSQELQAMYDRAGYRFRSDRPLFYKIIQEAHPGIGWAVLLTALIYFYLAVRPGRSRNSPGRRKEEMTKDQPAGAGMTNDQDPKPTQIPMTNVQ